MPLFEKYRSYFDIDPEFFPQVNETVIKDNPDLWKKFYPHETFVKLIRSIIRTVNRQQKVSVWVEGPFGTGKSHAVLTLKKLLDASDEEVKGYFNKYSKELSSDLLSKFEQIRQGNPILTVHHYGSSNINNDADLFFAIQSKIAEALREKGYSAGDGSLKDAFLIWLKDEINYTTFDLLIKGPYRGLFKGMTLDELISNLKSYDDSSALMQLVMQVCAERRHTMLTLDSNSLIKWIEAVRTENNLKCIIFFWDEFTEYFGKNMHQMTGFQRVVEACANQPFYFVPVTHNIQNIFPKNHDQWKKIRDHCFETPFCTISLPENMAFILVGKAMEPNPDPVVKKDLDDRRNELYEKTHESRELVRKKTGITDEELKAILPIHPYAALVLMYIASVFDSNQRSMFDFIKTDRGDEIKGFQWYIDNYGPDDENPLLTVDMLWDFFYVKGKEFLSQDVRIILDSYTRASKLETSEERVLKAVLLMQAVYEKNERKVELLAPTSKNIDNAFENSDLVPGEPTKIANRLCRKQILYQRPDKKDYAAMIAASDESLIEELKGKLRLNKHTSDILAESAMEKDFAFTDYRKLRFVSYFETATGLLAKIKTIRNQLTGNTIPVVFTFAKDDVEAESIRQIITDAVKNPSFKDIVFVDASITPLGADRFEQYIDDTAHNQYWSSSKQDKMAAPYASHLQDVLKKWRTAVIRGEFWVYTFDREEATRATNYENLLNILDDINRKRYPLAFELRAQEKAHGVTGTMWDSNQLPNGVFLGTKPIVEPRKIGQYSCCHGYIGEVWNAEGQYWIDHPADYISQLKLFVNSIINDAFVKGDRISIAEIYDALEKSDYAIMPCNLTAFVLGFILKDYTDGSFSSSDGTTPDVLDVNKLKIIVSGYISNKLTPAQKYRNQYIVKMTPEIKAFVAGSTTVFGTTINAGGKMENTRNEIRDCMSRLSFPIWCLKYILTQQTFVNPPSLVASLIDEYCSLANSGAGTRTDQKIATDIGTLFLQNPSLADDLSSIMTSEMCVKGMLEYLRQYDGRTLLSLADEIGDGGQYVNCLKKKITTAEAANWAWYKETVDQLIDSVILEYKIIAASNLYIPMSVSYEGCLSEWETCCDHIRISYLYAKNSWEDLSPLMAILYDLKKTGVLQDSRRSDFLKYIEILGEKFRAFYSDQEGVFKRVCSFLLKAMDGTAVSEVYKQLTPCFTMDKSDYQVLVENAITTYVANQANEQLKRYWREKTGTASPREWSNRYRMPVLCMIDEADQIEAKRAFDTINAKSSDKSMAQKALAFLHAHEDMFDRMNDAAARDDAFLRRIIKDRDIMLSDVENVRQQLFEAEEFYAEPYEWLGLSAVDSFLEKMTEHRYIGGGYKIALDIIDKLDISDVKHYLKELIENDMVVGMRIIKNHQGE